METQNYKRTIAGSVGAGLGAVMGSGRTYFILEHRTASMFHQMGESQKIIVDQIELGRSSSCQVRFDESLETVSRRHAAIERDGNNWKLINLSRSNPTLVNGQPISGSYYLQSGDEIQLSVGGPRMGFIIPQGRQALTSSIGLTERMSLFRQQALRPYKQALITICVLFVVAMAGMGYWVWSQGQQLDAAKQQYEANLVQIDSLNSQSQALNTQLANLQEELEKANDPAERQKIQQRIVVVKQQVDETNNKVKELDDANKDLQEKIEQEEKVEDTAKTTESAAETNDVIEITTPDDGASTSLQSYYDYIYTLKIDKIEIEYGGKKFDPGIATSDIVCGTGFVLSNGSFVTDRQNIHPWVYITDENKDAWRWTLAQYAAIGCKVIIHYSAYSTLGSGKVINFTNLEFGDVGSFGDVETVDIKITREVRTMITRWGISINSSVYRTAKRHVFGAASLSYGIISGKVAGGGIPYDTVASTSLPGGSEVTMVGYVGITDIHNLVPQYFNDKTTADGTSNSAGTIALQNTQNKRGYYGSPAFIQKDGKYYLVGMMVGALNGYDRLVPARNFCK